MAVLHRELSFAAALSLLLSLSALAAGDDDYRRQIETARAQRIERLKAPGSWLSLVGLHWISPGENTLGSAADNRIVLAKGPAHLGSVMLAADGSVTLKLPPDSGATIDGEPPKASTVLVDDTHDDAEATNVRVGTLDFHLIDRGGRKGLRATDTEAETRRHFVGLDYFAIDASWNITARWDAFATPRTLDVPNVLGAVEHQPVTGRAVFERDGRTYALTPIKDGNEPGLFFVMADATSGKLTYFGARFLKTDPPKDGMVTLDFNKAYNPPCAFTPYATCPIAPPENRLKLAVTAGEKKYRGTHR
ncbi:MAG: DUF1684 domain-containing protein [Nevskia sp.]